VDKQPCVGCTDTAQLLGDGFQSHPNFSHMCRADEASCIDGIDCPDYVEHCSCVQCKEFKSC
jgi:hypothetical protein